MPKGFKLVDWTDPKNDLKLVLSIVSTHNLNLDAVAAAFGAPKGSISTRLSALRKKAGVSANTKITATTSHPLKSNTKAGPSKRKGKTMLRASDTSGSDGDVDDDDGSQSPIRNDAKIHKTIEGRVMKKRSSPRKTSVVDYNKMENPSDDGKEEKSGVKREDYKAGLVEDEEVCDDAKEFPGPSVKVEEVEMGI